MTQGDVIDLFSGAGGWCEGAKPLGLRPLGIEWDKAPCATREAAGHRTLRADVAALDPADFAPCMGLIASPPCPTFSTAGRGAGRLLTDVIVRALHELPAGADTRRERRDEAYEILLPIALGVEREGAHLRDRPADLEKAARTALRDATMSLLVVEPLRWALALRPEWIAFEQVPGVLGLWTVTAGVLAELGYLPWVGVLSSERYGVPQTRKRAILMASRTRAPHPPSPTHQTYVPDESARRTDGLFGLLLPWVSMARALGWDEGPEPSPSPTVSGGGTDSGGGVGVFAGTAARRRVMRATNQPNAAVRHADEPALTIASGHSTADRVWLWPTHYDRRQGATDPVTKSRTMARAIPTDEPAPTVGARRAREGRDVWVHERPATTVIGDPRISRPGHHDGEESGSQQRDAVRVSLAEAAILQGFSADYPWRGSRPAQFSQVGNAIPPPLATAVLAALTGRSA